MYKTYEELMKNNPGVVIWGTYPAKEINCAFSNMICGSKDEIQSRDAVFIAIEALKDIEAVSAELDEKGISYCHIRGCKCVYAHI